MNSQGDRSHLSKTILIISGETSGDLHGGNLAFALGKMQPGLRLLGVGGPRMAAAGVELIEDNREMGVVGVWEVLYHLKAIRRAYRRVLQTLDSGQVDLVVLIDYPDFNFRVAHVAHQKNIPIVYYISPQVWAWRSGRIKTLKKLVRQMIVILPFEKELYQQAGVPCEFVGHPLLDEVQTGLDKKEVLKSLHLDPGRPVVSLLPGSRSKEVREILPVMLGAMARVNQSMPGIQLLLALAPSIGKDEVSAILSCWPLDVKIIEGKTDDVVAAADLALVASGTATLQAAILETPMVVLYRVTWFTFLLARILIKVEHMGLVNLVAGKRIVPELLQGEATPERIAEKVQSLLLDPPHREAIKKELAQVRSKLGTPGASRRAAEIILRQIA
jgi:lipid-A-disaccharide synthase